MPPEAFCMREAISRRLSRPVADSERILHEKVSGSTAKTHSSAIHSVLSPPSSRARCSRLLIKLTTCCINSIGKNGHLSLTSHFT
jgi:hypothetical protein